MRLFVALLLFARTQSRGHMWVPPSKMCNAWDVTRGHKVNRRAKLDLVDCQAVHFKGLSGADGTVVALARALEGGKNSQVVDIAFVNVEFGDNGLVALGKMLETNVGLTTLSILADSAVGFEMAPITHRASSAFAHGIGVHKDLTRLRLGDFVTDSVATDIAGGVAANSGIVELRISRGRFGDVGAIAFAEAFMLHPTLAHVSFEENRIGDAGAIAIAKWLSKKGCRLDFLCLSHNKLTDDGALAFADAIAIAAEHRNVFSWIDLMENDIGDAGGLGLVEAVQLNSRMEQVQLDGNVMRRKTILEVQSALKHSGEDIEDGATLELKAPPPTKAGIETKPRGPVAAGGGTGTRGFDWVEL